MNEDRGVATFGVVRNSGRDLPECFGMHKCLDVALAVSKRSS